MGSNGNSFNIPGLNRRSFRVVAHDQINIRTVRRDEGKEYLDWTQLLSDLFYGEEEEDEEGRGPSSKRERDKRITGES